ncbi:MAG TPA: pirin family protein, partial [Thiolinea sp.]|nr:pirin family protein [Thiolinea sp.]
MFEIRRAQQRGHFKNSWLDSHHSFSFGDYYDPKQMGISVLRVINDDRVTPGAGFPTHTHNNMEIISYVLEGELAHKDSMGNGSVIRKGDVQRMSAGSGIAHSEYNPSPTEGTHFLQIWLLPTQRNIQPSYAQAFVSEADKAAGWRLLVSPTGAEGS